MTLDNAPIDPSAGPVDPNIPTPQSKLAGPAPKKKRRWVRRIILTIVVLVVLLLIVIAATPAMLSSGAGRNFVLGKVNENLNGKVTMANWSIGWTGGIHADDIKVFDDSGRQILQIPRFSTDLSLVSAMRGKIHLGHTKVEGLDFFAERYADGSLNFAHLAKGYVPPAKPAPASAKPERDATASKPEAARPNPTPMPAPAASEAVASSHTEPVKPKAEMKLSVLDGELELIGCRGTFQDDQNPDAKNRTVEFKTITGDVKIASLNEPIENSLKIVVYAADGSEMANFSTDGKMLIAKDNVMLTPGQMKIEQTLLAKADLKRVDQGFGSAIPVHFTSGKIDANLKFGNDANGVTITPVVTGTEIAYLKDGVADNVGAFHVDGTVNMVSPQGTSTKNATTNLNFNKLQLMGVGSALVINGGIEDIETGRKFNNVTADMTYNLAMIWDAYKPWMTKEQKEKLKDVKISSNHTERFTLNGSLPGDKPFNEAIASLTATGEFTLDSFDGNGATLANMVVPISVAGGKARIAYTGKPAGQEFAPPADLNGGKLSLAGATIDLAAAHPTLSIPDGTHLLDNVGLNPIFARTYLAGWLSSPVFSGADKATGTVSVTVKHCDQLPTDAIVLENIPANKGVMDLNLVMTHIEIGSKLVNSLNSALTVVNPKSRVASSGVLINIPSFDVHIEHGVTSEDMKLEIGKNPAMQLAGTVVMKTNVLQMTAAIPLSKDQSVKLPVTGTVADPKLDTAGLLQKNLLNIPGVPKEIKGILGGNDKTSTTQPADKKKDAVGDLLNNALKQKPKDKPANSDAGDGK